MKKNTHKNNIEKLKLNGTELAPVNGNTMSTSSRNQCMEETRSNNNIYVYGFVRKLKTKKRLELSSRKLYSKRNEK